MATAFDASQTVDTGEAVPLSIQHKAPAKEPVHSPAAFSEPYGLHLGIEYRRLNGDKRASAKTSLLRNQGPHFPANFTNLLAMASNSLPNLLPGIPSGIGPEPCQHGSTEGSPPTDAPEGRDPLRAEDIEKLSQARHPAPHRILGPHPADDGSSLIIRTFQPQADRVGLRVYRPSSMARPMRRIHPEGLFEAVLDPADIGFGYEYIVAGSEGETCRRHDPYAFTKSWFSREDEQRFLAGRHTRLFEKLGARRFSQNGCEGVGFAVWAPRALRVSVVGNFNRWDGRCHPMRRLTPSGIWDLFIPGIEPGALYKFEILPPEGPAFLKADPFAWLAETPPKTAGIIADGQWRTPWRDRRWMETGRFRAMAGRVPAIYRLDLPGQPEPEDGGQRLLRRVTREGLADLWACGYTYVELAANLSTYGGAAGPYALRGAYGTLDDFKEWVEACHQVGLGVIVPVLESRLPDHYPDLHWFDGTQVYEAAGSRGDGSRPFALERGEVASFLLSNAVFWLERYHVDGLLTDHRAAALYRRLEQLEPRLFSGIRLAARGASDRDGLSEVDRDRLLRGRHDSPHEVLGPHYSEATGELRLRAFIPRAGQVWAGFEEEPELVHELNRLHPDGLFETVIPGAQPGRRYRLAVLEPGKRPTEVLDPYAFTGFAFSEEDQQRFGKGSHYRVNEKLGAHLRSEAGVAGVSFAVWAPNADGVSVVGSFNGWNGRCHPMHRHGLSGVWELFIPGVGEGSLYKFEIRGYDGRTYLKCDPYAIYAEVSPATASIVRRIDGAYRWRDGEWMARRRSQQIWEQPVSIYEVHLGSWMRGSEGQSLSYPEVADRLIPYVSKLGFTHIELLPISEYPYEPSWGYQVTGYYAPTSRYGRPEDLMQLIDRCHQAGLGVILDWVPGHFPKDAHGLARFDGTCQYEHADPRQGEHRDWGTLVFNYGRHEVENFLIANARFWLEHYHFDGLRVDAVASMLYLDYSRPHPGDWIPNRYGGRENLEAIEFLRHANVVVHRDFPGVMMIAEESTAWPGVSRPVDQGGLGFGYKWNMGWMHDVLAYMSVVPELRRHHHGKLTFCLVYAFAENYVLSLSHDEVVHLKGSLLYKMPGSEWERFANLRLLYAFMYGHPGKKLLFMGAEFGQTSEWNHAGSLDWPLLKRKAHRELEAFVRDLNRLYRSDRAFFEVDFKPVGFEWLESDNAEESIVSFFRKARDPRHTLLFVMNFSAVSRPRQRIGVPFPVVYRQVLNTNAVAYGGCGEGLTAGKHEAEEIPWNGREFSIVVPLPALTAIVFRPDPPGLEPADLRAS